jgi:dihydroorotase
MAAQTLLIKGGRIIDPASKLDRVADLLLEDGKVAKVGDRLSAPSGRAIDATNLIVCPGLIDLHVHLREPGDEDEETVESGTAAAVAGGFTSVACMPNTKPTLDDEASIEFIGRQVLRAGSCNVFPVGAITKGRQGKELAEIGQMVRSGAVGFSDDGCGIANPALMLQALNYVRMFDKPIMQHCEDADIAAGGVMNGGATAVRLGLPGLNAIAEELMLQRDLTLVRATNARYHVCHISTARSVELIRQAKASGLPVTAEVCSHHLVLTDDECTNYDPNYKMNPPLRTKEDVEACCRGVADGTIDALVTDHAPHGIQEKELEFLTAPFGIIGLETALPLFIKALIEPGLMDWPAMIDRLTVRPAKVISVNKGTLAAGADADVTLIDPKCRWTIDVNQFRSKSRNSPFNGWQVTGRAEMTIVGGEIRHQISQTAVA